MSVLEVWMNILMNIYLYSWDEFTGTMDEYINECVSI